MNLFWRLATTDAALQESKNRVWEFWACENALAWWVARSRFTGWRGREPQLRSGSRSMGPDRKRTKSNEENPHCGRPRSGSGGSHEDYRATRDCVRRGGQCGAGAAKSPRRGLGSGNFRSFLRRPGWDGTFERVEADLPQIANSDPQHAFGGAI